MLIVNKNGLIHVPEISAKITTETLFTIVKVANSDLPWFLFVLLISVAALSTGNKVYSLEITS